MNQMFVYLDITTNPFYNCSAMYAESEEQQRMRRPLWGISAILYGIITCILYSLCIIVMRKPANFQFICYKIMFFLGLSDLFTILINNIIYGYLIFAGISFCDFPNLLYVCGCFDMGTWATSCCCCLILVSNRILDIVRVKKEIVEFFFSRKRLNLLLILAGLYGSYILMFAKPPVFSSRIGMALIDPQIYENMGDVYTSPIFVFNNVVVVATTCSLYGFYCIAIANQFHQIKNINSTANRTPQQIFAQVTLICSLHFSCSASFTIVQFFPVPLIFSSVSQGLFQWTTGLPAIIYITLNKKIREGIKELFQNRLPKISNMGRTTVATWSTSPISRVSS